MPVTFGMKESSYLCSQITGGVENAVPLHAKFLAPAEEILIYLLMMHCRNIRNFPMNVFFQLLFCSKVIAVNFVLQITPEEKVWPVSHLTSPQ
jgi:hypothetical protein